jgi:FtsH-binding integral membrane protein
MEPVVKPVLEQPNKVVLTLLALFKCVMSAVTGAAIAAALCLFNDRLPLSDLSLLFIVLNALVGLVTFFATHFQEGKNRKAAFITAGGDPTGISVFMFGSLRLHEV